MSSRPTCIAHGLEKIDAAARDAGRNLTRFGTGHLLFTRIDDSYEQALDAATETLSVRYAMDFRRAAQRYCALGRPDQVVERIREFHAAGVRHVILDLLGPYEQRDEQIARFAAEAMPLLRDLTAKWSADAISRDLTAMLRPRSIALVGATDRSRWSQNTFDNLVNRKYAGDIYLVSRRGGTVHGRSAATSCVAVGAPIDLALLMVPMAAIDEALADLAAADVHNAVILTSGFAETGHEGADHQARLASLARQHSVSLLGPNCLGLVNFVDNVPLWTGGFARPASPARSPW